MTSIHQRLPDELLQMIINMVDDRPTLHTLLTVSKTVFDVSVKKLWEAPFHFEWNPNFIRLFTYVFAISPCCRPDIVALREELGIQKLSSAPREGTVPEAREEAAPYIDYLALVRHVDLDIDYASLQISDDTFTLIEQALPWIICNGQFGQFVSVSLSCVNVEALIDAIPTMTRLTRIKWVGITDIQEFAKSVRPFVEAFVDAHGERGRQIDLAIGLDRRFPYLKEQDEMDQILVDISRLLGPLPSSKRAIDDRFSWARCMAHLEHMDFSGVRELNMIYTPDFLHHILPRCRWLEKLWADVMVNPRRFLMCLSEASQPRRHQQLDTPSPHKMPRIFAALPLREVFLTLLGKHLPLIMLGLSSSCGSTLDRVELVGEDGPSRFHHAGDDGDNFISDDFMVHGYNTQVIHLRTARWIFPKLRRLTIGYTFNMLLTLDQGDMSGMPALKQLELDPCSSLDYSELSLPPSWVDSLTMCAPWKLPELHTLRLEGVCAEQFNQESLTWSPKLRSFVYRMDPRLKRVDKTLLPLQPPQVTSGRLAIPWLETLSSALTKLSISHHVAQTLELTTLSRCLPVLVYLKIDAGDKPRPGPGNLSLSDFIHGRPREGIPGTGSWDDCSPTPLLCLQKLTLKGQWNHRGSDFRDLLKESLMPRLKMLTIGSIQPCLLNRLVETSCLHPALQQVEVRDLEGNREKEVAHVIEDALGLEQRIPLKNKDMAKFIYFSLPTAKGYKRRLSP